MRLVLGIAPMLSFVLAAGTAAANVGDLVAQVSASNLVTHVSALEFDRSTPAAQAVAAAYITSELQSYGYTVETQTVAGSENLTATIVGLTDPDDILVLGAHFDTVSGSPGADDNASSVAAVLETARLLAGRPLDTTVHFVFFALEEDGYQGSEAYAGALAASNANVTGMISLDMIGYTCATPGCQIVLPDIPGCLESNVTSNVGDFIGIGANTSTSAQLAAFVANAAAYEPALAIETFVIEGNGSCFPQSRRSDHKSFWDEGYPAMILGDGAEARNPNYHQSSDVLATLDVGFMTSVTRAVVAHVAATTMTATPAVPTLSPAAVAILIAAVLTSGVARSGRVRIRGRRGAGHAI